MRYLGERRSCLVLWFSAKGNPAREKYQVSITRPLFAHQQVLSLPLLDFIELLLNDHKIEPRSNPQR